MRMKNLFSKIWAILVLAVVAVVAFQACAKDETTTTAATTTTKDNLKAASRSEIFFDDIQPPATVSGKTISSIFTTNHGTDNDTIRVVSAGVIDVTRLYYNNVCSLSPDTLLTGFVQNDTFRTKAPVAWITCFGTQVPNQTWDVVAEY